MEHIIIHTPTVNDWIEVVTYFLDIGYRWANTGNEIGDYLWYFERKNTCVHIHNEAMSITYSSYAYALGVSSLDNILSMNEFHNDYICNIKKLLKDFK